MIGMVASAAPAQAAYYSSTVVSGVNLRPCVDTNNGNCSPVGTTGSSTTAKMECWRDGSWATGAYYSNRWFLLELSDTREGFVHSSYVGSQTAVPNCNDLPRVRAADWAIAQIGQTRASEAYWYSPYDWRPGELGEWSGDCAKLPTIAYRNAGVNYYLANAINQWNYYANAGLTRSGIPRYGDPVWWNETQWGHTAIYIGGTTAVGTQGLDGQWKPVARYDIYSHANYLGWAKVSSP
ncbi:hypothetical protein [Micromonospora sp. L32]|uniref:hypothetical protein n=1 Tax=Micromonospora TaxID=1873 RepID=UPI003F8880B1